MQLDQLDRKAAEHFEGYVVRKDLVRQFSRQFPVPTYVVEFLLGRYCATTDEEEINEGLDIVQRQLASRTVKAGEQELFKARAREDGTVKLIDLIGARLDAKTDAYLANLPSLQLKDVRIAPEMVREHERLLTGGFYGEVTLSYDSSIAQEAHGRPFGVEALRAIQLSKRDVLDVLAKAREGLTTAEWKAFLLRSVGLEPDQFTERAKDALLLRMVPFVERNYNLVELGPRGTGKSHLFQQVSPYAHLISGGKATVAKMFVVTPELSSENSIGADPLEPGQAWTLSPGGMDEHPGLYRIEVNEGPGSGLRILNKPSPAAFQESVRYAQQNLYARAAQLVGDRDPRAHEFSVQLRGFDAAKTGKQVGVAALIALCSSLLKKPLRGGLVIIGEINLGGSIEPIHNAVTLVELAVEKGAEAVLMPVTSRRQLFDLSDDMATKVDTQFYQDARDALLKALVE